MKTDPLNMNYYFGVGETVRDNTFNRYGIVHKVFKKSLVVKYEFSTVRYTDIRIPEFLNDLIAVL